IPIASTSPRTEGLAAALLWKGNIFLLFLAAAVLFSNCFLPDSRKIDAFWFFHEGEWLAPAWKWHQTGELWTGSFFAHGAFYDAISSALGWKIFDVVNIAASRIITSFFEKATFFPLIAIMIASAHYLYARHSRYSAAVFTSLLIMSTFLFFRDQWQYFERRDLPALISVLFFLIGLCAEKNWTFAAAGFFLGGCWIYSIDRGIYITVAELGTLATVALLARDWQAALRQAGLLLAGFCTALFAACLLFGFREIAVGIRTTYVMFGIKDLSDGSAYPAPSFPITNYKFLRTTHTLPLVCLAIQLLACFSFLQRERWRPKKNQTWLVTLFFLFLSFAYYRGALSRCDELHYRYVSSFAFLGAAIVIAKAICDSSLWRIRFVPLALCLVMLWLPGRLVAESIHNMFSWVPDIKRSMTAFLHTDDKDLLTNWEIETTDFLAKEFKEEKCFYSIVSEPLWIYLLRKPHCGKFHLTWLISDKSLQLEALEELKTISPGKILMHTPLGGDKMDGIPIAARVHYLYGYIADHYRPGASFRGWEVWVKKN
ncbi:MAG: hypothetical protein ACXVBE_16450, partial [Bdellovibrionota bacterium]